MRLHEAQKAAPSPTHLGGGARGPDAVEVEPLPAAVAAKVGAALVVRGLQSGGKKGRDSRPEPKGKQGEGGGSGKRDGGAAPRSRSRGRPCGGRPPPRFLLEEREAHARPHLADAIQRPPLDEIGQQGVAGGCRREEGCCARGGGGEGGKRTKRRMAERPRESDRSPKRGRGPAARCQSPAGGGERDCRGEGWGAQALTKADEPPHDLKGHRHGLEGRLRARDPPSRGGGEGAHSSRRVEDDKRVPQEGHTRSSHPASPHTSFLSPCRHSLPRHHLPRHWVGYVCRRGRQGGAEEALWIPDGSHLIRLGEDLQRGDGVRETGRKGKGFTSKKRGKARLRTRRGKHREEGRQGGRGSDGPKLGRSLLSFFEFSHPRPGVQTLSRGWPF